MTRLELLQEVVGGVAETRPFDDDTNTVFFVSENAPDGSFNIGKKHLDGMHPLTELMGFAAPEDWWALGVVCTGWMAPMNGPRPSLHPEAVRIVQAIAVTRDGDVVNHTRVEGGEVIDEPPGEGMVLDALKRCLQLPTAPPQGFSADVFIVLWLQLVEAEARDARANLRKMTWMRAARRFPFADSVKNVDLREPAQFAEYALATVRDIDWERLRGWGSRGMLGGLVSPSLARWMDAGMFSRWLTGSLPPIHAQLERTCQRVGPNVSAPIREAVDALLIGAAAHAA
ncbi:MAG: hypothetical protein ACLGHT_11355 [Acidimicrobiia bacterium]